MPDSSNRYINKNSHQSRSQTASKRNHQGQKIGTNEGQICQYNNEGFCRRLQLESGKKCWGLNFQQGKNKVKLDIFFHGKLK